MSKSVPVEGNDLDTVDAPPSLHATLRAWPNCCRDSSAGRWEARIGIPGSKHIYLGLFSDEVQAARAYDAALVRLRGAAAATNFALSEYRPDLAAYHKMQQVCPLVLIQLFFRLGKSCSMVSTLHSISLSRMK
jgi:hypothetical protein